MDNASGPAPRREFRGVWIRASLWRRQDVSWFEKCLLAEIDSLGEACFASNGYLAQMMGTTPGNVANAISRLRQKGLIRDLDFNGRVRRLVVDPSVASDPSLAQAFTKGWNQPSQKCEGSVHPGVNIDTSLDAEPSYEGSGGRAQEQLGLKSSQIQKSPTLAEKVVGLWNKTVTDLPPAQALTTARRNAVGKILRAHEFNLAPILKAFEAVQRSDFLTGRKPGAQWKADFSWVMQEENFTRILEGAFDNKPGQKALTAADHARGF
jgi:hypothetical protein